MSNDTISLQRLLDGLETIERRHLAKPVRLIVNGVAYPADDVWFEPRQDGDGAICIGIDPR